MMRTLTAAGTTIMKLHFSRAKHAFVTYFSVYGFFSGAKMVCLLLKKYVFLLEKVNLYVYFWVTNEGVELKNFQNQNQSHFVKYCFGCCFKWYAFINDKSKSINLIPV